jgi:hypothetical protein
MGCVPPPPYIVGQKFEKERDRAVGRADVSDVTDVSEVSEVEERNL